MKIKKNSKIPIITKFADYRHHNDAYLSKIITMDKISTEPVFYRVEYQEAIYG